MSWLISKALMADYENSRSSQVPAAESLGGIFLDGERSALLNVMPTPHKFWHNDKMMEPSQLSRFGLTCAVLTEIHGEALLTWFREGFHAQTSPSLEMAKGWKASKVDCGWSSAESSMKYDLDSSTWKTRQCSLLGGLEEFSGTWPSWGSMHDGECSALTMPAWTSGAPESGLWPTPTASDGKGSVLPETARKRAEKSSRGVRLPEYLTLMGLLPGGRHNPEFSEWLMGWPEQWTAIEPLEMAKFHEWQRQHSPCSAKNKESAA